jgi:Zn-dependent M16 (insulinase) family peptidase
MLPDESVGKLEEKAEFDKLNALKKALSEEEKQVLVQEAYQLKKHQETI